MFLVFPFAWCKKIKNIKKVRKKYADRPTDCFWELESDVNQTFYRWLPNVGPRFFLCNGNVDKIWTMLAQYLQQQFTCPKKLLKSDQMLFRLLRLMIALYFIISSAMLSGASWLTLHGVLTSGMLSQQY